MALATTTLIALLIALMAVEFQARTPADTLQQFLQRDELPVDDYVAYRRLEAGNERFNATAWIEACAELRAGRSFDYRTIAEGGSAYLRHRVLRKALDTEREAWLTGEAGRSALTLSNYAFASSDGDDNDLVTVAIRPLRKDRMLVDGTMQLSRADGDLLRIDGRLAKNPSFWTTRVEVHRTYARVDGVRMPMMLESIADVRIAGRSTFRMTCEYVVINGRTIQAEHRSRCG